jgi:hypothetical protein
MLTVREVNGDAIDASPSSTWSRSSWASWSCFSDSRNDELDVARLFFPFFFRSFLCIAFAADSFAVADRCFASTSGALIMDMPTWARRSEAEFETRYVRLHSEIWILPFQIRIMHLPISFVPSPHMSVLYPPRLNAAIIASF